MDDKNYKGQLIQFCLTINSEPTFTSEFTGPAHDRRFICKIFIDGKLVGKAEGKQKKKAENEAAKLALESLGQLKTAFQPDYVALLNELCQRKDWTFRFVEADRIGPSHNPEFACSAQVKEKMFPESSRKKNKKLAKKEAAYLALKELKKEIPNDIQELPDVFKDESKSENRSYSGSTSDISLDRSTGENGLAQLASDTSLERSTAENGLAQLASDTSLDRSTAENGLEQSSTAASEHQPDCLAVLNELCQKKKWICNFLDTTIGGSSHQLQFSCKVDINGETYPESKPHKTKKLAKKEAVFLAWMELKKKYPRDIPEIQSGFIAGSTSSRSSISSPGNKSSAERGITGRVSRDSEITFHSSCPTPSNHERRSIESGLGRLSLTDCKVSSSSSSGHFSSDSNNYQSPLKNFEDFTILDLGAFGYVFKARQIVDERYYALKEIPVGHKSERHKKEVLALAKLEHPNIVRYFNSFWANSSVSISHSSENSSISSGLKHNSSGTFLFIQMELCENGSLKKWITDRNLAKNTVNKCQSLQFFKQIIEGVKYIHSEKLIHRDLKPANILFTKAMVVKIGDFGLVTQMTRDDESKARLRTEGTGTPSYMAPEQRDGNVYENEVDIYALGLILVELLWIFDSGHERGNLWMKFRKGDLPMDFGKQYPVEAYEIKKMLSEDPKKRPSATDLCNFFKENLTLDSRTQ